MAPLAVAVFGAAGLLGHRLVADLRRAGHRVEAVGRPGRTGCDAAIDAAAATESQLETLLRKLGPLSLVVNVVGALRNGRFDDRVLSDMIAVNSLWPRRLAIVTAALEVPLVHISTDAVFSDMAGVVDESSPARPDDFYGYTKLLGEPDGGQLTISFRCSFVGPDGGRGRGLWSWVAGQPEGAEIPGFQDQQWTGVTSPQISNLIEHIIDNRIFAELRSESRVHHLCPNPTVTKFELISALARVIRPDVGVRPATSGQPVTRRLITRTAATALITEGSPKTWVELIREAAEEH